MVEAIVSPEVAKEDFDRFCDMARIDQEEPRNENDGREFGEDRDSFIYYVMKGGIEVDGEGYPTVNTDNEALPKIRFGRRPRVTALRAMDKCKKSNENGKMLAMVADTLGIPTAKLNTLEYVDFKKVSLVFGLFLG